MHTKYWLANLKGRNHLGDPVVDERMLKCGMWAGFCGWLCGTPLRSIVFLEKVAINILRVFICTYVEWQNNHEQWMGKDVSGFSRGVVTILFQNFPRQAEEVTKHIIQNNSCWSSGSKSHKLQWAGRLGPLVSVMTSAVEITKWLMWGKIFFHVLWSVLKQRNVWKRKLSGNML
jgi:hypothetical protein